MLYLLYYLKCGKHEHLLVRAVYLLGYEAPLGLFVYLVDPYRVILGVEVKEPARVTTTSIVIMCHNVPWRNATTRSHHTEYSINRPTVAT